MLSVSMDNNIKSSNYLNDMLHGQNIRFRKVLIELLIEKREELGIQDRIRAQMHEQQADHQRLLPELFVSTVTDDEKVLLGFVNL